MNAERETAEWPLVEALSRAGCLAFFQHHRATMDDLLSTGGLSLLRDKHLLRQVTAYYRSSDFLIQFDKQKHEWIWIRYRDTLNRHVPHPVVAEVESSARRGGDPPDLSRVDWQGMRYDPDMREVHAALVTAGATDPASTP